MEAMQAFGPSPYTSYKYKTIQLTDRIRSTQPTVDDSALYTLAD